eukprot:2620847-Pyramimonas_sp.AAC.1
MLAEVRLSLRPLHLVVLLRLLPRSAPVASSPCGRPPRRRASWSSIPVRSGCYLLKLDQSCRLVPQQSSFAVVPRHAVLHPAAEVVHAHDGLLH